LLAPICFLIISSFLVHNTNVAASKVPVFIFLTISYSIPQRTYKAVHIFFRMVHLYLKVTVRMYRRACLNWLTSVV
jgi:hypothetical protein